MIKLALHTNLWQNQPSEEQLTSLAQDLMAAGYQGITIDAGGLNRQNLAQWQALTAQTGLGVTGVHTQAPLFDSEKMKNEVLPQLEELAACAQAVQAQYLVLSGQEKAVKYEIDFRIEAEMLNRAGRITNRYGLRLAYHNHLWEVEHQLRELRALVSLTQPALVSLLLNVGWIKRAGGNPAEVTRDYLKRISAFQLSDVIKDQWVEIGTGKIDFGAILKQLPQEAETWLMVDQNGLPNPNEAAAQSARYLQQLIARLSEKKRGFFSRWTGRG